MTVTVPWSVWPSRKTVLRIVKVFAMLLLVGPFVVHAMPQLVGATHSYVVISNSMAPTINAGDIIIIDSVDATTIQEGDIITFQKAPIDERPTTHRVVEVTQSEEQLAFRTKGDANEDPDQEPVPANRILGEVVFVVPYLGYVIRFANTTYGFVALVAVPLGLLIVTETWSLVKTSQTSTDTDDGEDTAVADGAELSASGDSTLQEIDSIPSGESTEGTDDSADTSGYTLTRTDLRLTGGVLFAFAAYSGWIAYTEPTVWSVTVAVAAAGGFLLVIGLVLFGGSTPSDELADSTSASIDDSRDMTVTGHIVTASITSETHTASMVSVSSLESLIDMAITNERHIIKDPNDQAYFLFDEDVVYTYPSNAASRSISGESDIPTGNSANGNQWDWIRKQQMTEESGDSDGL